MIRQSLIRFVKTLEESSLNQEVINQLTKNGFHKQLRNELIMLPIPKIKTVKRGYPTKLTLASQFGLSRASDEQKFDALNRKMNTLGIYYHVFLHG